MIITRGVWVSDWLSCDERRPQLETLMRKRENSRQKSRFVLSENPLLPIILLSFPLLAPLFMINTNVIHANLMEFVTYGG